MSERTRFVALAETAGEAERALAAGADLAPLRGDRRWLEDLGFVRHDASAALAAANAHGVLVDTGPGRLFDVFGYGELEALARDAMGRDQQIAFAGALEGPDVPRLVPLHPAFLVFDTALRGADGAFDAEACRAIAALFVEPQRPADLAAAVPDKVFIRDFVQEMALGAYAAERGRRQRVRFSIEAELAPVAGPRAMGDVYSYDRMMDAVRAIAAGRHEAFVETLAEDLAATLLADERLLAVTVRVEKLDLGPGAAGVEIRREAGRR
ncbi:dihydroneopterin aldolase [Aureimonas mangrovi]|uniref:dihydroneopterin aldolase n=1 Tax=Aureimonas mangrovi TaxID=2758041 RepID=UPI00163D6B7E|nr:dihydroneopterin aldolase [Aureimonas mangrovi]